MSAHAKTEPGDLLDAARQSGHFDVYMKALAKTGMVAEMEGDGPFTIFAPTDEAFARMPEDKREILFSSEHVADLRKLLRYYIVPGRIPEDEADVVGHVQALTQQFYIKRQDGQLMANDAKVVVPAKHTSNGILYGIDRVLMPHYQNLFLPGPPNKTNNDRSSR
ncbi:MULTISPECIES: fasciclin domain-containing protein [unclassified Halomonas]|uniref:fasciclin domain-containing protein n=1 Tax=unclassified Halomonas TaxID=2609666 RepID=UPI001EF45743|nr:MULTISPECIES: fasciclin domain-containing protein [unclassified Halomonas]MCP1362006.1 fasciclin domain-containing protein [Halomonas sp. BBD45]MCP1363800.1 fasciclin domain-containing protein [Halomonas sp. BBD48]